MNEIEQCKAFRNDKMNNAVLYSALAEIKKTPLLSEVYQELAAIETGHAKVWSNKLQQLGVKLLPLRPALRTRVLVWLAKRLGPEAVLQSMVSMENSGTRCYVSSTGDKKMAATEHSHALLLNQISSGTLGSLIPIFPYYLLEGINSIVVSAFLVAIGLIIIGAAISFF